MSDCGRRTGGALRPRVQPLRPETAKSIALRDVIQQVAVRRPAWFVVPRFAAGDRDPCLGRRRTAKLIRRYHIDPGCRSADLHEGDPTVIRREFGLPELELRMTEDLAAKSCEIQQADA